MVGLLRCTTTAVDFKIATAGAYVHIQSARERHLVDVPTAGTEEPIVVEADPI
jgi:hypothetical protein